MAKQFNPQTGQFEEQFGSEVSAGIPNAGVPNTANQHFLGDQSFQDFVSPRFFEKFNRTPSIQELNYFGYLDGQSFQERFPTEQSFESALSSSPFQPTPESPPPKQQTPQELFDESFQSTVNKIGQFGLSPGEQRDRFDLVNEVLNEIEQRRTGQVGGELQQLGRFSGGFASERRERLAKTFDTQRATEARNIRIESGNIQRNQLNTAINTALQIAGMTINDVNNDAIFALDTWAKEMGYETELAKLKAEAANSGVTLLDYIMAGAAVVDAVVPG